MEVSIKNIQDMQVITTDGRKIGTVVRGEIDTAGWKIRSITVAVRKEDTVDLGLTKPLLRTALIDVSTSKITNLSDYITLNISLEELKVLLEPETAKRQTLTKK